MRPATELWNVEVTDTFSGEANYSWVRRYTIAAPKGASQRSIMRRAKAAAGLAGSRGRTDSFGDSYSFHPSGACIVLFATWTEPEYAFGEVAK